MAALTRMLATSLVVMAGCGLSDYEHGGEVAALEAGKADGPSAPHKQWTFVMYGAADNDLADSIRSDVNELESVGSTADVNFLAFLDRPEGARVYYLMEDDDPVALPSPSASWGTVDSGDPNTLTEVVDWASARYPADHIVLVIGGHGGGTPRVIAPDFSTGNAMTALQLEEALERLAQPLELFGADACLMQSIEVAFQLRKQAAFIVGSVMTEPADGWDYAFVGSRLLQAIETERAAGYSAAEVMVAGYSRSYSGTGEVATLSALDTAALDETGRAQVEELASAIIAHAQTSTGKAELQAHARAVRRVGAGDDFADAQELARRLQTSSSPALRDAARTYELLLQTPDSLYAGRPSLVHVGWGGRMSVSTYFPTSGESREAYERDNAFAAATGWSAAIEAIW